MLHLHGDDRHRSMRFQLVLTTCSSFAGKLRSRREIRIHLDRLISCFLSELVDIVPVVRVRDSGNGSASNESSLSLCLNQAMQCKVSSKQATSQPYTLMRDMEVPSSVRVDRQLIVRFNVWRDEVNHLSPVTLNHLRPIKQPKRIPIV